jgi:hypothetical protein
MGFEPSTADASLRRWYHGNSEGCSPDFGWQMQPLAWALTEKDEDTMPSWSLGQLMRLMPEGCLMYWHDDRYIITYHYLGTVITAKAAEPFVAVIKILKAIDHAQKKR